VGSVAYAEHSRLMPQLEAVDLDGEQFDLIPVSQFADTVIEPGRDLRDFPLKGGETVLSELIE